MFKGLLRSKGFFWLATRPNLHGEWSQAGTMLTLQGGGPWFCTIDDGMRRCTFLEIMVTDSVTS